MILLHEALQTEKTIQIKNTNKANEMMTELNIYMKEVNKNTVQCTTNSKRKKRRNTKGNASFLIVVKTVFGIIIK